MSEYLSRRIDRLDKALVAVDGIAGKEALRDEIAAERNRLDFATARDVADRTFELAVLVRLAPLRVPGGPAALLADLAADPALRALQQAPALSNAAAAAVIQLVQQRFAQGNPISLTDIPALRIAAGGDATFEELVGILHGVWLALDDGDRPYLERDVAVMLPVRLETLFKQPNLPSEAAWEMLLRVIPDEASIRRDDPTPKPVEIVHLEAMWRAIFDGLSAAERADPVDEWLELAARPRGVGHAVQSNQSRKGGVARRRVPADGGGQRPSGRRSECRRRHATEPRRWVSTATTGLGGVRSRRPFATRRVRCGSR